MRCPIRSQNPCLLLSLSHLSRDSNTGGIFGSSASFSLSRPFPGSVEVFLSACSKLSGLTLSAFCAQFEFWRRAWP